MSDLTELARLPVAEALGRFRDRSLSPAERMTAVLARAEAVRGDRGGPPREQRPRPLNRRPGSYT